MADINWYDTEASTSRPLCENCGRHVTRQFARVFGDNLDTVHGCLHCTTARERQTGEHIPQHQM
jgi:transposase-like protein